MIDHLDAPNHKRKKVLCFVATTNRCAQYVWQMTDYIQKDTLGVLLTYNKELNLFSRPLGFNGLLLFPRVKVPKVFHRTLDMTLGYLENRLVIC